MGNGIRVKKKHLFYNPNRKRPKSDVKYKKAMEWYILVKKKASKPWFEKWVEKTMIKVENRLKKYGITQDMLKEYLEKKWLENLID